MLVVVRDEADVPGHEEEEQPHQDQAARHDQQLASLASTHFLAFSLSGRPNKGQKSECVILT